MNYFQPYLPPLDDAIVAAWDSQIAEAAETPFLAQALAQSADLFPRFAACYAQLRALPRGARRALQRQLARSGELTAVPPEWRGEAGSFLNPGYLYHSGGTVTKNTALIGGGLLEAGYSTIIGTSISGNKASYGDPNIFYY